MERQLKFRAWDGNQMIYDADNQQGREMGYVLSRYESNVMQFTGKQDKEGTDIYEGDIIEFDRSEWGGDDNIHVVSWDEVNAAWDWGGGVTSDMGFRKVIGNIYSNPESITP